MDFSVFLSNCQTVVLELVCSPRVRHAALRFKTQPRSLRKVSYTYRFSYPMRQKESSGAVTHRHRTHLARRTQSAENRREATHSESLRDALERVGAAEMEAETNETLLNHSQRQASLVIAQIGGLQTHNTERFATYRGNWQLQKRHGTIFMRSTQRFDELASKPETLERVANDRPRLQPTGPYLKLHREVRRLRTETLPGAPGQCSRAVEAAIVETVTGGECNAWHFLLGFDRSIPSERLHKTGPVAMRGGT